MFTRPQLKSNELRMAKTVQPLDPSKSSASVHRPESNHEYTIKASQTIGLTVDEDESAAWAYFAVQMATDLLKEAQKMLTTSRQWCENSAAQRDAYRALLLGMHAASEALTSSQALQKR